MKQSKIEAMLAWPINLRELCGFLGLIGYYQKFVKGYSDLAWPLTDQLKNDSFGWCPLTEEAFQRLKRVMTQVPVLALPNFSHPFMLKTDASRTRLGVVLMQNQHPIAFFNQVLSNQARS